MLYTGDDFVFGLIVRSICFAEPSSTLFIDKALLKDVDLLLPLFPLVRHPIPQGYPCQ